MLPLTHGIASSPSAPRNDRIHSGVSLAKKEAKVKQELNRFLHYLEVEKGCSPGTIEAYRHDLGMGLFPFLREIEIATPSARNDRVEEVAKDDIRAYMDFLALEKGNSNITRRRKLASIKSFFNYLMESEELEVNPAASIKSPKIVNKEPVYLSDAECLCLLKAVALKARRKVKERDMAIIILFLHTGLRVSELTNLELVDVDLNRGQIKITRKGNKEQYLHLNGETVGVLVSYLNSRPPHMRLPRSARNDGKKGARNDGRLLPQAQNDRFFVGTGGGNLTRTYVYDVVRRYMKLAGINKGKYGPHLLRHTFCTRLHQKGVDPMIIKELAGHQSLNTTMRYIKIESKEQAEAVVRLEFGIF